ncbi:UbiH/UbiF/VisC/COQ6 family ubiquinone biosynthesis hydroxylase [Dongia deserti]|uniref:UbiH/UbiF/VisC/COQ6 family ubiquinone biosynthesis hydroxylase n=1 Tax=Dongia deserti TaxID=2268030 RepID=UPI000E646F76|nr:UbiH/UbiF/VisC/COQ6 family ubiquinone biosynthesis hydroxylase [Dongia deserti]
MIRGGVTGENEAELIVVGGGLVGLTLAIACADGGIRTIVVEAESADALSSKAYDGRSSAIAHGSQQVLHAIGAWDRLASDAQPILDIRVTDGGWHVKGESHGYVHYSHLDLLDRKPDVRDQMSDVSGLQCEPEALARSDTSRPGAPASTLTSDSRHLTSAPFGYIIENRLTRIALLERAKECANLTHLAPYVVTALDIASDAARVTLGDGRVLTAQLIVAADGKQSALRRMAGVASRQFGYNQTAIVCTVMHEKPHHGVAHEHFLPAGPFAMLPMTDEILPDGSRRHRSSIVWSEDPRLVPMLLKLDDDAFGKEIERRFGLSLGQVRPLGPRFSYPLTMTLADSYVRDRFALTGDAAHGIHPIAGQGFNLGVRDVAALAEVLVDASRGGFDLGSMEVLERYARWRRFDNLLLSTFMDGLTRLFSNDFAPLRFARDLGFTIFNRTMPLKRLAMRHAMGIVGKLPRLVQGRPL